MILPLEGIKVLDLSLLLPGPWCTMLLADFGADVLKIEAPGRGDFFRMMKPKIKEEGSWYLIVNRNKRSMTLNLRTREGKEIFTRMAKDCDVIIEQFRPGVVDRLGVGYEDMRKVNPRVVYASISGFGSSGPYRDLIGHDINYLGISGILDINTDEQGKPVIPGILLGDVAGGGMMATIGILLALMARERTGKGQYVDIAMLDGVVSLLSLYAASCFARGTTKLVEGSEMELLRGDQPLYSTYETKEGKYLTIGAFEPQFWGNLCRHFGWDDFVKDHYSSGSRKKRIFRTLREKFLTKTRDEWLEELEDKDVCIGRVNTLEEAFQDPQILHRHMFTEIEHPIEGKLNQFGIPIKLSETPGEIKSPPPVLGQHTEEVLLALGYHKEDIERLREAKVI